MNKGRLKYLFIAGGILAGSALSYVFRCRHEHYSFPITPGYGKKRPKAAFSTGMYVSCLDCGKEFPYDWTDMRVIDAIDLRLKKLREQIEGHTQEKLDGTYRRRSRPDTRDRCMDGYLQQVEASKDETAAYTRKAPAIPDASPRSQAGSYDGETNRIRPVPC